MKLNIQQLENIKMNAHIISIRFKKKWNGHVMVSMPPSIAVYQTVYW